MSKAKNDRFGARWDYRGGVVNKKLIVRLPCTPRSSPANMQLLGVFEGPPVPGPVKKLGFRLLLAYVFMQTANPSRSGMIVVRSFRER